jgi:hypothetical protein
VSHSFLTFFKGTITVASENKLPVKAQTEEELDRVENLIDATSDIRREQLNKILIQGLQQADEKRMQYTIFGHKFIVKDQVAQAATFIQAFKGLVNDAVKVSPEASLAWAGVCVFLPLLTNPSAVEKENHDGLDYVNSRIRYYVQLEHLLWPDNLQDPGLKSDFESHIIEVYKRILEFQLKTALRLYRNRFAQQSRDMARYDNWKELLDTIKNQENIVERESELVNTLSARQNLESIRITAETHYNTMQSLLQSMLSIGKEQLQESKRTKYVPVNLIFCLC